jgi:hypothetical protein
MTISISEIEEAEFKLVDLAWRLPPGDRRDQCTKALGQLREILANMIARNPSILRKGNDMLDKRTHQAAADQRVHDSLRDSTGGHCCASYAARDKVHSGVVDTEAHLHRAHHALVDAGRCKCDASNAIPGGMPRSEGEDEGQGTYEDEQKRTASRAAGLAKRTGRPVPRPAGPARFYWEQNGTRMGLDDIERRAEVDRIIRRAACRALVATRARRAGIPQLRSVKKQSWS